MNSLRFIYWQEDEMWHGYLEDYPDYRTQGKSVEELQENLRDIYSELVGGAILNVRRVGELQIS
jgi:predicted RNase H-like HicB family nuclease